MFETSRPKSENDDAEVDYWLSYADLMSGVLLVFIILLLGVLVIVHRERQELEKQKQKFEKQKAALQAQRERFDSLHSGVGDILGVRRKLITRLKGSFEDVGSQISFDDATGAIRLGSRVLFAEDSATLSEDGKKVLRRYMPIYFEALFGDPRLRDRVDRITIEGHTNSNYDGVGSEADAYLYNLRLSQQRAYNAMRYVIEHGIGSEFQAKERLQASGFSSSRLLYKTNEEGEQVEDKVRSRRIEIRFRLKNREALKSIRNIYQDVLSEDSPSEAASQ